MVRIILRLHLPLALQYAQRFPKPTRVNAMDMSLPFHSHNFRPLYLLIHIFLATHHNPWAGTLSRPPFPPLFQTVQAHHRLHSGRSKIPTYQTMRKQIDDVSQHASPVTNYGSYYNPSLNQRPRSVIPKGNIPRAQKFSSTTSLNWSPITWTPHNSWHLRNYRMGAAWTWTIMACSGPIIACISLQSLS